MYGVNLVKIIVVEIINHSQEQDPAFFGNNSAAAAKKVLEIRTACCLISTHSFITHM